MRSIFRQFPLLLALLFIPLLSIAGGSGDIVSQTFEGVTVSNPGQPASLNGEFPPGTPWSLEVAWIYSNGPLNSTVNQASYRLITMTLTLRGTSGDWISGALMEKASFSLFQGSGFHEVQFTSGSQPSDHSNPTIGTFSVDSINLTLADQTSTAIPALTPTPQSAFDLADFSPSVSLSFLKVYIDGFASTIVGGLGTNPTGDPDLAVREKGGSILQPGSAVRFRAASLGSRSQKKVLLVGNNGLGNLGNLAAKLTGPAKRDFSVSFKGATTLAPGQSKSLEIEFEPRRSGKRSATLKLNSNDPDSPVFLVKLKGRGKGR
ncbi:MAG: choice-of-anchor D domain-containing protein [Verrucomicrobiae bacterium]|nr:choice-of-anchor D domain-containing protein [Verrucomicrobiae bacterium]